MQHNISAFQPANVSDFFQISQRYITTCKVCNTLVFFVVSWMSFSPWSRGLPLIIIFFPRGFQQTGFNQGSRHRVRVTVGSRTSVLKVPAAPPTDVAGDANTNITTGSGCREVVETGGGEASHVVSAIVWIVDTKVLRVTPAQPSDCLFNVP